MPAIKPIPLIILGMHRSGTSCLAGTLEQAGVYLGAVSSYNKYNQKGNKENSMIMNLNNEILKYNDASWKNVPRGLSWNSYHEKEGKAILDKLKMHCNSQYYGFKDPRVLLTLPFWKKLLPDAKFIGTFRNPHSVAKSLSKRSNSQINIDSGLRLWLDYNQRLISYFNVSAFPLISFDLPVFEYQSDLVRIFNNLELLDTKAISFFDKNLRSESGDSNLFDTPPELEATYETLQRLSKVNFVNREE